MIPELEHSCGSWVVTRKKDGTVIGEFFKRQRDFVERFNLEKVTVETTLQYLVRINKEIVK